MMRASLPLLMLLSLGQAACFSLEAKSWGEWVEPGAAGPEQASAAGFDWSDWPGMVARIDGNASPGSGYKKARLRPGRHVVEYSAHVHDFGHIQGAIELELKPGHLYRFGFDTCYWCKPRRHALWVDDTTSGEVAWGKRPDWPAWFL